MSIKLMAQVWELDLPSKEKLLLLALADAANDFGASCYPSVATISRKTSMPERTVQRMLKSLIGAGVLSTHYERGGGKKLVRHFRFRIDGVPDAPIPDYTNCPKKLRLEVIAAFGETCVHCHKPGDSKNGGDGKAWHIDRILPGSRGGKYVAENVALSCATCNISRGAKLAPEGTVSLGAILDREGCQIEHGGVPKRTNGGATHGTQSISEPSVEPPEEPPPGLDWVAWRRFLEYRKALRKPIKPVSIPAAQRKLAGFGSDQAAVVEQSIANSWQGLFALKDDGPSSPRGETDDYYRKLREGVNADH